MTYKFNKQTENQYYVAPVLGNGNMTFQVDYEGNMFAAPNFEDIRGNNDMRIWWAARRYAHKPDFDLVSFGRFGHLLSAAATLVDGEQSLDVKNAVMNSVSKYADGTEISSEVFIHHDMNLIAVKKDINGADSICFEYDLCDIKDADRLPELLTVTNTELCEDGVWIQYKIDAGMYPYEGIVGVFSTQAAKFELKGNKISATSGSNCFYILFCDKMDYEDYVKAAKDIKNDVLQKGYEAVKAVHMSKWNAYMSEGYAKLGDEGIDNVYDTAQYHLKCYTTNWSLPVGLNNGSWQGRYFAFDEFYMFMGLITSNHMNAAVKIPKFRRSGLDEALFRTAVHAEEIRGARYPWETLENGKEGAPIGFWMDHIFHMACISCGAYYYYRFTDDIKFLEEVAYPMVEASAIFYMYNMVYKTEGGKTIIGKCTDLERLGPFRENTYMTTCGVIKTLEIYDTISNILGIDKDFVKECRETAEALKNSLPNDGEKYIPYADCKDISIALISGTYPFNVIAKDSKLQKNGIQSYLDSEAAVGNMYAVGSGVCSWYMTWKAVVFARHNMAMEAYEAVKNASKNSGSFGEMYEILDISTNTVYRPWFTTAAGMLVHSVNEMLLSSDNDTIYIAPALPETVGSFAFKLAAYHGALVEAEVVDNKLVKLCVKSEKCVDVVLPSWLEVGCDIDTDAVKIIKK